MPSLYFTVGLPRSGKSTLAKEWLDKKRDVSWDMYREADNHIVVTGNFTSTPSTSKYPRAVVCGDDFREAIHGDEYHKETEGFVGATVFAAIRALLKTGHDVLFDETNSSEWSIRRIFDIDPNAVPIYINTALHVCEERAKTNGQENLLPVIERVDRNLQKLDIEKIRREYVDHTS